LIGQSDINQTIDKEIQQHDRNPQTSSLLPPLRVPRDREARAPQAQAGPHGRRRPGTLGDGGRVARSRGAPVPARGDRRSRGVRVRASPRPRARPARRRRERRQAPERAGGVRGAAAGGGAAERQAVPRRRGRRQPRRPQPLPGHALPHGHRVRAPAGGGVAAGAGVVGGARHAAGGGQGRRVHAAGFRGGVQGRRVIYMYMECVGSVLNPHSDLSRVS
jgi:hypothetical protein